MISIVKGKTEISLNFPKVLSPFCPLPLTGVEERDHSENGLSRQARRRSGLSLERIRRAVWLLVNDQKPSLLRGDIFLGNEGFLAQAEQRGAHYLTKLRLTANVKRHITKLFRDTQWVDAGKGFEGAESALRLTGWSRERRVIILRRQITGEVALAEQGPVQLKLAFIEGAETMKRYEYAVLVISLPLEVRSIAQLYRDRADCENCFDELKNQWGWGGFTTKDLKRCRLASRLVALVYNWWSLFVRLAQPDKHAEAITSRPLLLHGVARQTKHAGQTTLTITSSHAKSHTVRAALQALNGFLEQLKNAAEQLSPLDRLKLIARYAFRRLLGNDAAVLAVLQLHPALLTG